MCDTLSGISAFANKRDNRTYLHSVENTLNLKLTSMSSVFSFISDFTFNFPEAVLYEFFNIGEIADFFQIPKSKLRYWDKEGLIRLSRNSGNDYREYSLKAVSEVANVAFYRSINVSIKELKKLSEMDIYGLRQILESTQRRIDQEIANMQKTQERLQKKIKSIAKVKAYTGKPFILADNPMSQIVTFVKGDREQLQQCIDDSEKFVFIFNNNVKTDFETGLVTENPRPEDEVIWSNNQRQYLKGLLKLSHDDRVFNGKFSENFKELQELYNYLDARGYKYGLILARFLVAEFGDSPTNYYETYVELL